MWILCRTLKWPISGTFCCGFHSPFADNQPPPPRLARGWEKNLYSSFGFDIYFPRKNKRQVQNFSWLSENISTTGPESPRHISRHALLRTSFPPSSALLIEELHWWQCWIFIALFNEHEQCGRERRGNGCMLYHLWWCTLKARISAYWRRELHAEIHTWKIRFTINEECCIHKYKLTFVVYYTTRKTLQWPCKPIV